ncbi:transporter substrate-binding domain-containing protein [Pseudomonas gingeri]|uniref:transporter substrate-binding domain-containing protein n=1 Tax=Pseudomonas gingeri TaxID=117681 RepID=UPI0015A2956D|nr:transporter substrate-binding domain-containing protein [Pseudomonas gingeri]NVZ26072.1 transporter substrate-binding domain-containing protein [Pseudomonas gingeri]NVZ61061.1 transporter substrate-binding domain-containing protein [Pseudomonas gingeri]NVZ74161.1 transporter substrate-binding domain-containing protein [Pseudomonas gingeri]NWA08079.1 transporter substrate-binding domain-containing protein [Pseudomonas gingeri]
MTFSIPTGFSRVLFAALLLAGTAAEAAQPIPPVPQQLAFSRLDQILQQGVLRVGTTGDYKPFSYKTSERFIGLDIELAEGLASSLGVRLELVPTTWPTLMSDLQADRFDLGISGISVNMERQKQAFFSQPYQRDGKTPITLCSRQQAFQTLEQIDRPQVRAIVNPGGTNEKFARANLKQAQIVMHEDNVTIFQQIVDGKADLMMTDAVETLVQQKLHPELCAVHPDQPFDFSEKAMLLPRDIVLKQYVDQWLHQDMESGRFAKRLQKWLAYPWQAAHN